MEKSKPLTFSAILIMALPAILLANSKPLVSNIISSQRTDGNTPPPLNMVHIPGGSFQMGDSFSENSPDELPVHKVTLDSFYIGKYEVTNAQYCQYLNSALGNTIYISGGMVFGSENNQPYP